MKHINFNRTKRYIIVFIISALGFSWNLYYLFQPNIKSKTLSISGCILALVAIILTVIIRNRDNKINKKNE